LKKWDVGIKLLVIKKLNQIENKRRIEHFKNGNPYRKWKK